jgi:hypothetical protein
VSVPKETKTLTWHFNAPMVHDFTWAADKITFMICAKGQMGLIFISCTKQSKICTKLEDLQPKNSSVNGVLQ